MRNCRISSLVSSLLIFSGAAWAAPTTIKVDGNEYSQSEIPLSQNREARTKDGKTCWLEAGGLIEDRGLSWFYEIDAEIEYVAPRNSVHQMACAKGQAVWLSKEVIKDELRANIALRVNLPAIPGINRNLIQAVEVYPTNKQESLTVTHPLKITLLTRYRYSERANTCLLVAGGTLQIVALLKNDYRLARYEAPNAESPGCRTGAFTTLSSEEFINATTNAIDEKKRAFETQLAEHMKKLNEAIARNLEAEKIGPTKVVYGFDSNYSLSVAGLLGMAAKRCDVSEFGSYTVLGPLPNGQLLLRYGFAETNWSRATHPCPDGQLLSIEEGFHKGVTLEEIQAKQLAKMQDSENRRTEMAARLQTFSADQTFRGVRVGSTWGAFGQRVRVQNPTPIAQNSSGQRTFDFDQYCETQAGNTLTVIGFNPEKATVYMRYTHNPVDSLAEAKDQQCGTGVIIEMKMSELNVR